MQDLIKEFLDQKSFVVAGSFSNESKYAYKILRRLMQKGCVVYPVNPAIKTIDGIKCYMSIKDIPFMVDVASLVTPPLLTEKIVKECKEAGINRIWLQPGAENENAIAYCRENNLKLVYKTCILLSAM